MIQFFLYTGVLSAPRLPVGPFATGARYSLGHPLPTCISSFKRVMPIPDERASRGLRRFRPAYRHHRRQAVEIGLSRQPLCKDALSIEAPGPLSLRASPDVRRAHAAAGRSRKSTLKRLRLGAMTPLPDSIMPSKRPPQRPISILFYLATARVISKSE